MNALAALLALAQTAAAISGTVRADSTEAPIPFATVEIAELGRAVSTDEQGNFVVRSVPAGVWTVRASALGHGTQETTVDLRSVASRSVAFRLRPVPIVLGQINVEASRVLEFTGPSPARVGMETLNQVPALVELDVLRSVTVLPAITSASDYSSALYVRGGTPDQTEILLDGFPVHNPYHLGGVYGAFNPDAVQAVEVFPGAMPASLGSRISSVVRVETRHGGQDRVRSRGGLGLTAARLEVDGPVPALPGTFLLSGRKSYRNFTGGGLAADGIIPRSLDTGFDDVLAKWRVPWAEGNTLEAIYFQSGEWVDVPLDAIHYDWGWGSRLLGVRSHLFLGSRLSVEASAARSTFDTDLGSWWFAFETGDEQTVDAHGTHVDDVAELRITLPGDRWAARLGGQVRSSDMRYDSYRIANPPEGLWDRYVPNFEADFSETTLHGWGEIDVRPLERVSVRVGVRATSMEGLGSVLQPRAGLRLGLSDGVALTAGAGRHVQSVHSIRAEEAAGTSFMAFDVVRPATAAIGPPTAEDVVVGLELRRASTSLRVDGFWKRYRNLALPPIPTNPWDAEVVEPANFVEATGVSRGVEVLADYVGSDASLWVSYALRAGERTLEGFTYTPRFERRHNLDLLASLALPDRFTLSLRTVYASGQPTSPVVSHMYPLTFDPELGGITTRREGRRTVLGAHNSIRMPAYVRVDVGGKVDVTREVRGRTIDLTFRAQVVNVLNRTNVIYWNPSTGPLVPDDPARQFPITMTAGIEWAF